MKQFSWLISLAIFLPLIQMASSKSLINSTCLALARHDPAIDYGFCTTSLQASPASHHTTLQGLATITLRLLRYNLTDTCFFINNLIKKNRAPEPYLISCLTDCFKYYSDTIPAVKLATRNCMKKRFDDANIEVSMIMTFAETCQDDFEERSLVSPLTERYNHTFQLSAIALSLFKIIPKQSQPGL